MPEPVVWTDAMVQMIERGLAHDRWRAMPYALSDRPVCWPKPPAPQMIIMRDAMDYWLAHRKEQP